MENKKEIPDAIAKIQIFSNHTQTSQSIWQKEDYCRLWSFRDSQVEGTITVRQIRTDNRL